MTREAVVVCDNLLVRYGARAAVDGISFTAIKGEVVTLLGPNGAGKTSTVETLEGYRRPSDGQVRVLGLDPFARHRELMPRLGVMLQSGGVYPMLSPRRALDLFASYYEHPESTDALLELVDLRTVGNTPWRHLSGGEQQRLSLALALVGRPEVLMLDEPTSGVDPHGRVKIRQVITDLRARGACIILTTHELAEAERISDRVLIIRRGQVVAEGTPRELATLAGPAELCFDATPGLDIGALSGALHAAVTETGNGEYRVLAEPSPQITAALTAWLAERDISLTGLRTVRSLEEIYLSLVGDADATAGATDETTNVGRPKRTRRR